MIKFAARHKNAWFWAAGGAYVAVSAALVVVWPFHGVGKVEDFNFFDPLVAARIISSGSRCIYCAATQQTAASLWVHGNATSSFVDPPPAAFVLQPIAQLDVHVAVVTLLIASMLAVVAAGWLLGCRILPADLGTAKRFIVVSACFFTAASNALWAGQWTPLLLLPAVAAVLCIQRGRNFTAGLLLSLLFLKPQLVWLLPIVLIGSRQWKAFVGMTAGGLVWVAASVAILGWQHLSDWQTTVRSAFGAVNYSDSIPGFVAAVTSSTNAAFWSTVLLGVIAAVAAIRWGPRLRDPRELAVGIGIAASLLTTPHVYNYDLILLALPICLWARTDVVAALIAAILFRMVFAVSFALGSLSPTYWAWIIPLTVLAGMMLTMRRRRITDGILLHS